MPGGEDKGTDCDPREDVMTLYGEPKVWPDPIEFIGEEIVLEALRGASRELG